jgi:hypothetical protein
VATPLVTATALLGVNILICGLLAHYAPTATGGKPGRIWTWIVIAAVALDLIMVNWGVNPGTPLTLYQGSSVSAPIDTLLLQDKRLYINPVVEDELKFNRFFRFNSFIPKEDWANLHQVYLPNSGILSGLSSANNFDPLLPARYSRWMDYLATADAATQLTMLRTMGVGAVEKIDHAAPTGVAFEPVEGSTTMGWSSCAIIAASEETAWTEVISKLTSPNPDGVQGNQPIIIEGSPSAPLTFCDPFASAALKIISQNPNQTEIHVQSSKAGWVILADVWYPGWQVFIDGKKDNLLKADYIFMGVAVPAGEHEIRFVYRPYSVYVGFCISLLALAGIIFVYNRGV